MRGGSFSSSKERRRLLPASLGEAATSFWFAASMEEVAASVLRGWDSGMVVVQLLFILSHNFLFKVNG